MQTSFAANLSLSHDPTDRGAGRQPLPISKLRGLTTTLRAVLKHKGITTCTQLLHAAARAEDRERLARGAAVDETALLTLVRRADMARVNGIGTVFGMMLEELGVADVGSLAAQDPETLHASLREHNQAERIARRSPTPEEVTDWVQQARALTPLVTY